MCPISLSPDPLMYGSLTAKAVAARRSYIDQPGQALLPLRRQTRTHRQLHAKPSNNKRLDQGVTCKPVLSQDSCYRRGWGTRISTLHANVYRDMDLLENRNRTLREIGENKEEMATEVRACRSKDAKYSFK
jgi:hypothetical protein